MSKEEFLDLTPLSFQALLDRDKARLARLSEMTELMGAQMIAMVANTGFKGWDKPREAEEFMPTKWRLLAARKERPVTGEDVMLAFAHIPKAGQRVVIAGRKFG